MPADLPQSVDNAQQYSFHDAYRFDTWGEPQIEGTVYKVRPRYTIWEATIDGTDIQVRAETRKEATEEALRQARKALGFT
jgi:hypothetical protein